MRLYELLPMEGKDMFGYFLALRAITQRNLDYFLDHQQMFEVFIDTEEPISRRNQSSQRTASTPAGTTRLS